MRKVAASSFLLIGAALLVFGLTGYRGGRPGTDPILDRGNTGGFSVESRIAMATGATLVLGGYLLRKRPTS